MTENQVCNLRIITNKPDVGSELTQNMLPHKSIDIPLDCRQYLIPTYVETIEDSLMSPFRRFQIAIDRMPAFENERNIYENGTYQLL